MPMKTSTYPLARLQLTVSAWNRYTSSGGGATTSSGAFSATSGSVYSSSGFSIDSKLNSSATAVAFTASGSAGEVAAAVNSKSDETGVTANARTVARLGTVSASGSIAFDLYGADSKTTSTSNASISALVTDTTDLSSLAEAINKESGKTGISAVSKGSYVELVSDRGDAIKIENFSISGAATANLTAYNFDGSTAVGAAATLNSGATNDGRVDGQVIFEAPDAFQITGMGAGVATAAGASSFSLLESVKGTLISALRRVLRMLWVSSTARFPILTASEPSWVRCKTVSRTPLLTCKALVRTLQQHVVGFVTLTMLQKPRS